MLPAKWMSHEFWKVLVTIKPCQILDQNILSAENFMRTRHEILDPMDLRVHPIFDLTSKLYL